MAKDDASPPAPRILSPACAFPIVGAVTVNGLADALAPASLRGAR